MSQVICSRGQQSSEVSKSGTKIGTTPSVEKEKEYSYNCACRLSGLQFRRAATHCQPSRTPGHTLRAEVPEDNGCEHACNDH